MDINQIKPFFQVTDLKNVADLFRLARVASHGTEVSSDVFEIFLDYQTMIADAYTACGSFVLETANILKQHKFAVLFLQKDKFEKGFRSIEKCAKIAHEMAHIASKLVTKTKQLSDKSNNALLKAVKLFTEDTQKQEEVPELIKKLWMEEAVQQARRQELEKAILDEERSEKEARSCTFTPERSLLLPIFFSTFTKPFQQLFDPVIEVLQVPGEIGKVLMQAAQNMLKTEEKIYKEKLQFAIKKSEKECEKDEGKKILLETQLQQRKSVLEEKNVELDKHQSELSELEQKFNQSAENQSTENYWKKRFATAEKRRQCRHDLVERNINLASTLVKLKYTYENRPDNTILLLGLTNKVLGKIRTVFDNICLFLIQVKHHCVSLSSYELVEDLKELKELGDKELFLKEIQTNVSGWVCFGTLMDSANTQIKEANDQINHLGDLPTHQEANEIVQKLAQQMLEDLKQP